MASGITMPPIAPPFMVTVSPEMVREPPPSFDKYMDSLSILQKYPPTDASILSTRVKLTTKAFSGCW